MHVARASAGTIATGYGSPTCSMPPSTRRSPPSTLVMRSRSDTRARWEYARSEASNRACTTHLRVRATGRVPTRAIVALAVTGMSIVVCVAVTNCMGLDWVTASQSVVFFLSLFPSLLFIAIGLPRLRFDVLTSTEGEYDWALLVSWALWLYSGFSSLGSMAGEVDSPKRVYPCVVAILLPLVSTLNILPFAVALSLDQDGANYTAGYFGVLAGRLSGRWLQTLFVIGANLSQIGLYHSQARAAPITRPSRATASGGAAVTPSVAPSVAPSATPSCPLVITSRAQMIAAERSLGAFVDAHMNDLGLPLLLPRDRGLPPPSDAPTGSGPLPSAAPAAPDALAPWHWRCMHALERWLWSEPEGGGATRGNVLFNAAVAASMTLIHLEVLVEVEMMLYAMSHLLFLYTFIALRVQRPMIERPFRLPGGTMAACCYCACPCLFAISALVANFISSLAVAGGARTSILAPERSRDSSSALAALTAPHMLLRPDAPPLEPRVP